MKKKEEEYMAMYHIFIHRCSCRLNALEDPQNAFTLYSNQFPLSRFVCVSAYSSI